MRDRIQRAAMLGLVLVAGLTAGACLAQPGMACGDSWCPEGYLCTPVDRICIKSECGNSFVETGEECDDGNLDDEDNCLSTCRLNTCGDGKVNPRTEECDDGNLDDEDDCLSTCKLNRCGDGKVNPRTEECDDGNTRNDDGCNNDCTVSRLAYIKASSTGVHDEFGRSVALSADGSTLAVGAYGAGVVYVFTRRNGTAWSQQAYVKASSTGAFDGFGNSVALSADGSTLAVGASYEDSAASGIGGNQDDTSAADAGAVYVFTRSGTVWSQQAYVKASNTGTGDQFGNSVALSADGSTLAVGAWLEASAAIGIGGNQGDNSRDGAGAVYVFTRSGTMWSQQAYVKASNTDTYDQFGYSVALSADGSTLAVGAWMEASAATGIGGNQGDNSTPQAGAVYAFTRSGTVWSQQAYIKASNTGASDTFGNSVALSADGSTLAVGAWLESSAATGIGGNQDNNFDTDAGAVYVFTRSGTTWSQQAYVKASNTDTYDEFGNSVALSADGSILAVGASFEDSATKGLGGGQIDKTAPQAGAVYVFTRSGTTWSQQAYVKASNTGAGDQFGYSVALSAGGSTLAVGAIGEASAATGIGGNQADNSAEGAGAVYVYSLPAQQSMITTAAPGEPAATASAGSAPDAWPGQDDLTPILSSYRAESSALLRF